MTKVLITGGFGFVGCHLARRLLETTDKTVILLDNQFKDKEIDRELGYLLEIYGLEGQKRLEAFIGELQTIPFERIKDCTEIYHMAAINGTDLFYKIPGKILQDNINATFNLIEKFKNKKCKIVFTSSGEVYSGLPEKILQLPTPETTPVGFEDLSNARWSYGLSKIVGEATLIYNSNENTRYRYTIVRLHNVYGPRMGFKHVIPALIARILSGENPMTIKNPNDTRSFCYIDDVIDGLLMVMASEEMDKEIVNIGNPEETEISRLAGLISGMFSPDTVMKMGEVVDIGSANRRCPDITKLKTLGYQPKVSLKEGVTKTYEWYKENSNRNS